MILIITHKEDFTTDFVIQKLNARRIKYFRFNCEDIAKYKINISNESDFSFSINDVSNFSSVWFRRTKLAEIETKVKEHEIFILADFEALLDNAFVLMESLKWLSHPRFVYRAENKLLQLKVANEVGFDLPSTIVTNDHSELKDFALVHNRDVIIKPIRQGKIQLKDGMRTIFTNILRHDIIDNLALYDLTPCIVQNRIEKAYELRITIVDDTVFAARVNSQENQVTVTDWRKAKNPFMIYDLPQVVEAKCIELLKKLNISFGAIDLVRATNGDYIFLEINPNGQWAWIETETGLKISDRIIDYLTQAQ